MRYDVSVFTLGCKTNYYESQRIIEMLAKRGLNATHALAEADAYVINTCAVTAEAEGKSRQAVARALALNASAKIFLVGCACTHDARQFFAKRGVVCVLNNDSKFDVVEEVARYLAVSRPNLPFTPSHTRAYVKIQDGCNNFCSYCIVPHLRGRSRSRTIADIAEEVRRCVAAEVVLIGIDVSQFGRDNNETLPQLFDALDFYNGRIRLGSLYQHVITPQLLTAMSKRGCKHFHLSLQSGCDVTLAAMNRHYTTAQFYETVKLIREFYPLAAITTDVIVGFCGENDQHFAQTLDFLRLCAFADVHYFPYSPRKGTAAYGQPRPDAAVVKARLARLAQLKEELRQQFFARVIAEGAQTVLIEQVINGYSVGYTDNYVKTYLKGVFPVNTLLPVTLIAPFRDGVIAEAQ